MASLNHVAIVTGSNHGIGAATAERFASDGIAVLVTYLRGRVREEPATPERYQQNRMRSGDEVVQLYSRDVVSSVTTYEKNLRGFERIHLKPGETKSVTLTLTSEDLALWDRTMRFVVEPGAFKVMIGSGSEDIRLNGEFEILPQ